jgi:hypothetical protein
MSWKNQELFEGRERASRALAAELDSSSDSSDEDAVSQYYSLPPPVNPPVVTITTPLVTIQDESDVESDVEETQELETAVLGVRRKNDEEIEQAVQSQVILGEAELIELDAEVSAEEATTRTVGSSPTGKRSTVFLNMKTVDQQKTEALDGFEYPLNDRAWAIYSDMGCIT